MVPLDPRDPHAWSELAQQWQQAQSAWLDWWGKSMDMTHAAAPPPAMPVSPSPAPSALAPAALAAADVADVNTRYQSRVQALWSAALDLQATGGRLPDLVEPLPGDRRFGGTAWREQPYFALLKQSYLLYAEYLRELARLAPLPAIDKRRLEFATKQYLDAIAPTNFAATNPDVLAKAVATEGASLVQGLRNLADDAQKGRISMTDERAFAVGRNLAVTPGSVVFRNDLIELLQYDATTATVYKRPLVIVPPCINKYYILDLKPENSFVAHAVAQGHTVFVVSWRNIPEELGQLTWDDYIEQGALMALRVAQEITGSKTVNALGFCVGGTILACALAVLAARRNACVASATLLTTMLDFADPGEIGVYVSRELLSAREPQLMAGQRIHGSELASAFASLRANELVWNYVVGNYLKGETPPAFDLLYWNGDSANLPGPMYVYYLRNLYLDNRLREGNALTMAGAAIDLARIAMPLYLYASREDHIVPWRSAYRTTALAGGDVTFVLGASGHIAGVINPPLPV
ncbi:MAG: alpha/beta fold hydrolase, partial [Casimicrobiaceae bacterium]